MILQQTHRRYQLQTLCSPDIFLIAYSSTVNVLNWVGDNGNRQFMDNKMGNIVKKTIWLADNEWIYLDFIFMFWYQLGTLLAQYNSVTSII